MRKKINIKVKRLDDSVELPSYATDGSVGADLMCTQDFVLPPGHQVLLGCGFALELPEAYEAQVRPRSSMVLKHGITVANAPGTIDSDYRGEVKVLLLNTTRNIYRGKKGTRVAQMVINPVTIGNFIDVDTLDETERGSGGFGSTGS